MKKSKIYNDDPIAFKTEMQMKSLENKGVNLEGGAEYNRVYEVLYELYKELSEIKCTCKNEIKTGQTSVMCCNICGKPDEKFWN